MESLIWCLAPLWRRSGGLLAANALVWGMKRF
jgi:hypothetical protein